MKDPTAMIRAARGGYFVSEQCKYVGFESQSLQ